MADLTPRELELGRLVADGLTNTQIAERLHLSSRTVTVQVGRLYRKAGVEYRPEFASWARQHGVTGEGKPKVTLTEIKRRIRVGQVYAVTNHRLEVAFAPVVVRVKRTADYAFVVEHALGESPVRWPPARFTRRDDDGTLHLMGTGENAGLPFLTLVPLAGEARDD